MSFNDLMTRAAALLKPKPAEPSKGETAVKTSGAAAKPDSPNPKKP